MAASNEKCPQCGIPAGPCSKYGPAGLVLCIRRQLVAKERELLDLRRETAELLLKNRLLIQEQEARLLVIRVAWLALQDDPDNAGARTLIDRFSA